MNLTMIILTLFLLRKKIMPVRVIIGALLGGIFAIIILVAGIRYGIVYIIVMLINDFIMLIPSFVTNKRKFDITQIFIGIIYFHGLAFAYTKLEQCISRLGISAILRNTALLMLGVIIIFLSWYQNKQKIQRIYKVLVKNGNENIEFTALYDTGNVLSDPISNKPVSIVEESQIIRAWINKYPQKYKVIPYRSIGKENGILEGTIVDEIVIRENNREIIKKSAIIAIYKGSLSKDGSFQMILNNGLL